MADRFQRDSTCKLAYLVEFITNRARSIGRESESAARRQRDSNLRPSWLATVLLLVSATAFAQAPDLFDESHQPFVNKIIISGNQFFSDKDLKKHMTTKESSFFNVFWKPRLRMDFLRRDIAALEAFYHANGFLEAKVQLAEVRTLEDEAFVDIHVSILENEATRVEQVSFDKRNIVKEKDLRKDLLLKPGVPYNPSIVSTDIYTIKRSYFEEGYLGVDVTDSVSVEGLKVRIHYRISPGPTINIRNIRFQGNKLTKDSIVEKELAIKRGETFRLNKVIETQRNLFDTGLFTDADLEPENLDTANRTVDILVRLRERKSAYVEVGFGVGNILGSRVFGEWGDRNLLGTGRRVRLKTEYSFSVFRVEQDEFGSVDLRVKYYRYDGEFNQRHLFGTKVLLGLNAFVERDASVEPFVIRTTGISLGGRRHLGRNTDVLMGISHERIRRNTGREKKSTSRIVSTSIAHDTRDFILDPGTGGYRDLRTEVAGGVLGGDNDFYTITTSNQRYFRIKGGVILALRGRVGFADAYGASSEFGVPFENRYFSGGGNSVRGFEENDLGPTTLDTLSTGVVVEEVTGGRALLLTNIELRYPLPLLSRYRFSGAFFLDGGNVWASLRSIDLANFRPFADRSEITPEDYRYSVGFGIRYNTPVGPIRLDYGIPIKKEEGVDSSGRFHISLGQIF